MQRAHTVALVRGLAAFLNDHADQIAEYVEGAWLESQGEAAPASTNPAPAAPSTARKLESGMRVEVHLQRADSPDMWSFRGVVESCRTTFKPDQTIAAEVSRILVHPEDLWALARVGMHDKKAVHFDVSWTEGMWHAVSPLDVMDGVPPPFITVQSLEPASVDQKPVAK